MDRSTTSNCLEILAMAVATMMTLPCAPVKDCEKNPEECNATQVLTNFKFTDIVMTSDSEPPTYCEKYNRTSLSEDSATAEYNMVYTLTGGNNTPDDDICTFQVLSNNVISVSCKHYSSNAYELTLDYVNGNNCFVGHCSCIGSYSFQYYFFSNPQSDVSEYLKCFKKFNGYSGEQVNFLYALELCEGLTQDPQ